MAGAAKNVILVHGGFVDGSGWEGVYKILRKDGFAVSIVQNPTTSLADDVAVTKRVIAGQTGPVILVGHSYGGAVITEAGTDPKVIGLVYSPRLLQTRESLCRVSSRIRRQELRCHQSCRPRTASCSSTRRSSLPPSLEM